MNEQFKQNQQELMNNLQFIRFKYRLHQLINKTTNSTQNSQDRPLTSPLCYLLTCSKNSINITSCPVQCPLLLSESNSKGKMKKWKKHLFPFVLVVTVTNYNNKRKLIQISEMNRDLRNCHYQSFGNIQLAPDRSTITDIPVNQKKLLTKQQMNTLAQQFPPSRNYSSMVVDDSISFADKMSPRRPTNSQKNITLLRQSEKLPERTPSTYQHSQCARSINGQTMDKLQQNHRFKPKKQTGHIYQQIIKVLQSENHNLKEQNKYMLGEYKLVVMENQRLKSEVQSLQEFYNLKLEVKKLTEINQTYEKLVEELKYILMQEMVAIHQKINFIMSSDDVTEVYNDLSASLKKSTTLLNTDYPFNQDKTREQNVKTLFDRDNLQELLSIEENEDGVKQQIRTFETFQSLNNSNAHKSSRYEMGGYDSPVQTTFLGQLKA